MLTTELLDFVGTLSAFAILVFVVRLYSTLPSTVHDTNAIALGRIMHAARSHPESKEDGSYRLYLIQSLHEVVVTIDYTIHLRVLSA